MLRHSLVAATLAALFLAACAGTPDFDTSGVDAGLGPQAAGERAAIGTRVLWGGVVLSGRNEADRTLLEVVGYPLDGNRRPDTAESPIGRFIVEKSTYLELADYGPGRRIAVVGPVRRIETGSIGEASYRYPVVDAEQLHAWAPDIGRPSPAFHIGVGVIFSR
jgi:outer membrane lipoprotein